MDELDIYNEPKERPPRMETVLFAIICLTAILATVLFGAVDNITWILLTAIWMIAISVWAASGIRHGITLNKSALLIPLVGLLFVGIVQMLPLVSRDLPVIASGDVVSSISIDPMITRLFVLKLAVFCLFFAACLSAIDTQKRLKIVVSGLISFGALMAFYGILQRLADPEGIYGLRETKQAIPFGPFVNQHHFATFMQMTGGLAIAVVFSEKVTRNLRFLAAAALVIMGAAAAFTSSRGGLIGFAAMIALVAAFKLFQKENDGSEGSTAASKAMAVAGVAGIGLVIIGLTAFLGAGDSLLRGTGVASVGEDISSGRFHFWPIAVQIFLANPILGTGFDTFGYAFTQYDSWSGLFRVEQAHNDYLQILAESGVVGCACVAVFIFLLFKRGIGVINASSRFRRAAAIGALAGCFGVLIHSFFDFPLRTYSNAFVFLLLVAIATVDIPERKRRTSRRQRT